MAFLKKMIVGRLIPAMLIASFGGLLMGAQFLPYTTIPVLPTQFLGSDFKTVSDTSITASESKPKPLWAESFEDAYRSYRAVSMSA